LAALDALATAALVPEPVCRELDHAYIFLRTAEHRRQLGWADPDLDAQVQASRSRVEEICASIDRLQG
jgi:glutamine synthetase adenylyltransferase